MAEKDAPAKIAHPFEEQTDDKGGVVIGTRYPDRTTGPVCAVCGCLADEHQGSA